MLGKRTIAIHLPQFHAIPENDAWWGKGFTDWVNVQKARPVFSGHYQPHIPLHENYYDLSLIENLHWQKSVAKEYGIYGFCFYHYWFSGKLLLERPAELILKDKSWDFPFCMCWANENWTRRWDGKDQDILIDQRYSVEDDITHFNYFLDFFHDDRYIKVVGKPILLIYRSELFPNITKTLRLWRELSKEAGLAGLYLIEVESFRRGIDPTELGFDASFNFQPDWGNKSPRIRGAFLSRVLSKLSKFQSRDVYLLNKIYSYEKFVEAQISINRNKNYKVYPSVMPGWDNSARRATNAVIFEGSTPEIYEKWLRYVFSSFSPYSPDENFIFINAWNEWAEGNHLEPCEKWGYAYLEATKNVLSPKTIENSLGS